MPSYHPDLPQGHDLSCGDWPWQGGRHSYLQETSVLEWGCYGGHWGFLSNKCVYYMHINYSWNFHQNIFTLTISFIVLNAAIEFVLIYRPHPVLDPPLTLSFTSLFVEGRDSVCVSRWMRWEGRGCCLEQIKQRRHWASASLFVSGLKFLLNFLVLFFTIILAPLLHFLMSHLGGGGSLRRTDTTAHTRNQKSYD